jgi:hypothetical protein
VVLQLGGGALGLKLLTAKNMLVTKDHKKPRTWTDSLIYMTHFSKFSHVTKFVFAET